MAWMHNSKMRWQEEEKCVCVCVCCVRVCIQIYTVYLNTHSKYLGSNSILLYLSYSEQNKEPFVKIGTYTFHNSKLKGGCRVP